MYLCYACQSFCGGWDLYVFVSGARMIRDNDTKYVSYMGLGFYVFVLHSYPTSCILHWHVLPNKYIPSIPLRSESAVSATDCQNQCEAAAEPEGCRSINFNSSAGWCQLFSISAIETVLVSGTGISIYESCPMMTALGGWTVLWVCIDQWRTVYYVLNKPR